MSDSFETELIQPGDPKSGFTCGQKDLDRYFKKHALTNEQLGVGKTFVLRGKGDEEPLIMGFYTLSMASVASSPIAEVMEEKLPRYPMPVVLLGRLAVHSEAQGRGVGGFLLFDALERAMNSAQNVGCVGIIVDAKDENAASFYAKYGFVQITQEWPRRMFLSFRTFEQAG